jgi:hypothetical protein
LVVITNIGPVISGIVAHGIRQLIIITNNSRGPNSGSTGVRA